MSKSLTNRSKYIYLSESNDLKVLIEVKIAPHNEFQNIAILEDICDNFDTNFVMSSRFLHQHIVSQGINTFPSFMGIKDDYN